MRVPVCSRVSQVRAGDVGIISSRQLGPVGAVGDGHVVVGGRRGGDRGCLLRLRLVLLLLFVCRLCPALHLHVVGRGGGGVAASRAAAAAAAAGGVPDGADDPAELVDARAEEGGLGAEGDAAAAAGGAPAALAAGGPEVRLDVVEEHVPEELRHEAVDEEVDGAVDDHEELRDGPGEVHPEREGVAAVLHVALVVVDGEYLQLGEREREKKKYVHYTTCCTDV